MASDPPALEKFCGGPTGRKQALTSAQHLCGLSTIRRRSPKIASACGERGVRCWMSPVTASDWGAKKGEADFHGGGDAETMKDAEPILGVMGQKMVSLAPERSRSNHQAGNDLILDLQVMLSPKPVHLTKRRGIQAKEARR